jgi:hypothetical protein
VLRPQDREVISGDLFEEYSELQQTAGRWPADRRYVAQALSLVVVELRRRLAMTHVLAGCWVILFFGLLRSSQTPPFTSGVETEPLDPHTFLFVTAILLVAVVGGVFLVAAWLWFIMSTQRRARTAPPRSSSR